MSSPPPTSPLRSAILGTAIPDSAIDSLTEGVRATVADQGLTNMVVAAVGALQSAASAVASAEVMLGEVLRVMAEREAAAGGSSARDFGWVADVEELATVLDQGNPDCEHEWKEILTMGAETLMCEVCGRQLQWEG